MAETIEKKKLTIKARQPESPPPQPQTAPQQNIPQETTNSEQTLEKGSKLPPYTFSVIFVTISVILYIVLIVLQLTENSFYKDEFPLPEAQIAVSRVSSTFSESAIPPQNISQ